MRTTNYQDPVLQKIVGNGLILLEQRIRTMKLARIRAQLKRKLKTLFSAERDFVLSRLRGLKFPTHEQRLRPIAFFVTEHTIQEQDEFEGDADWILSHAIDWTSLQATTAAELRPFIEAAMRAGAARAAAEIKIYPSFNVRNLPAENWIKTHVIPFSARYAEEITARTHELLRLTLADGMAKGEAIPQMMERIEEVYHHCQTYRAEMIARTETARAYGGSRHETYRESGVTEHEWIDSGSPYVVPGEVCFENAALGPIPIDQSFTDINGNPIMHEPAHPNCECEVRAVPPSGYGEPVEED